MPAVQQGWREVDVVNLLPMSLIAVAAAECIGDACESAILRQWSQCPAMGRIVEVAHHDDAWHGADCGDRVDGLLHIFHYVVSQAGCFASVEAAWEMAYD